MRPEHSQKLVTATRKLQDLLAETIGRENWTRESKREFIYTFLIKSISASLVAEIEIRKMDAPTTFRKLIRDIKKEFKMYTQLAKDVKL